MQNNRVIFHYIYIYINVLNEKQVTLNNQAMHINLNMNTGPVHEGLNKHSDIHD